MDKDGGIGFDRAVARHISCCEARERPVVAIVNHLKEGGFFGEANAAVDVFD